MNHDKAYIVVANFMFVPHDELSQLILDTAESQSNQRKIDEEKDQKETLIVQEIAVVENKESVKCIHCGWIGKRNAWLKHLRMKPICKSMYDMQSVYDEQNEWKKIKQQNYNKMHYAENKEDYQIQHRAEKQEYDRNYYEENKEDKKKYYKENKV